MIGDQQLLRSFLTLKFSTGLFLDIPGCAEVNRIK